MGHNPLLQVDRSEMVNLPQSTASDQVSGLLNGRHKAIVEGYHMLNPCFLHGVKHTFGFFSGTGQRFLT